MKDKFQLVTTNQLELTSDDMIAGHSYKISVHTTTLQGETSEQKSAIIERTVGDQPLQISLGGDIKDHDPSKPLAIGSQVSKSMCASLDLDGLAFGWEAESTADVDLSRFTRSKIRIPPGYMKGGSNYTIKVLAMVINDMSITAEASVTISTMSQDLVAKIARAPVITTGSDSKLVLDGSASYDPDRGDDENDSIYHIWTCERVEEDEEGNEELGPVSYLSPIQTDLPVSYHSLIIKMLKNDRSSATKEIAVEVKEGSPPKVSIDEIEGSHNPNKDLVIAGSVLSPLDFAVTWSCVEGEGYEVLDVQAFSNANGKNYGGNGRAVSVALVVAAEFLKPVNAAPQCTDVTNTGGTSGTALTDEFTAVMEGCDDDETDFPLPTESQLASEISTKLSAGVRKFGCQVCDINKACADYVSDTEITLSNSDFTTSNIDQILEDAGDDVALEQEMCVAGGESPLISQVLDNVESMDDPTDEVKEMVVTLGDMLTSSTLSGINAQLVVCFLTPEA
ncbi:hypothetical protein EB796_011925 [Bugula neritina]|uniref:PKD/REJ-like domain-containing protein n=1 Tax=Bugula neritina TaxID=10212 RepID=A0A7J7JWM2_BUGNE|nr:hypothetical protein EB796_011925 [Bugula neritina]